MDSAAEKIEKWSKSMAKGKKKNNKGLLIGGVLLLLLAALYGLVLAANQKNSEEEAEETIPLFALNREEIVKISYTNLEGTYHFQNVNHNWVSEEEPEETLSQSYLVNIRNIFTGLDAESVVDTKTQNLENYGLDQPSYSLTAVTEAGEEYTLYIGMFNSSMDQYYAYTNKTEGVYLISKRPVTYIEYRLSDMISTQNIPYMAADTVSVYRHTWNGETISLEKKEEGSVYDASDVLIWFLTTGFSHEVGCSTSVLEELFENTAKLAYRKTAAANVTEEDLGQYGLDVPKGSLYIEYRDSDSGEEKVYELLIGDLTEEQTYYVMEAQSDKVYTMSKEDLENILNNTKYDYVYRYPAIVNVRTVDRIVFEAEGVSYTLGVRTEEKTEENGTTATDYIYSYQGIELGEEQQKTASSLYSGIISLGAERIVDQPEELGEPIDFSILFERKSEPKEVNVLFYPYNSSYYLCSVNGDAIYLINQRDLEGYKSQIFAVLNSFE